MGKETQILLLVDSPTGQTPEAILDHFQAHNTDDFKVDSVIHAVDLDYVREVLQGRKPRNCS